MKESKIDGLMPYLVEGAVKKEVMKEMGEYNTVDDQPEENPKYKKTRGYANMISDSCYKMQNAEREGNDEMKELIDKQAQELILKAIHELSELWSGKEEEEEEKKPEEFVVDLGPGIKVMSPKGMSYEVESVTEDLVLLNDGTEVWKVDRKIVENWIK